MLVGIGEADEALGPPGLSLLPTFMTHACFQEAEHLGIPILPSAVVTDPVGAVLSARVPCAEDGQITIGMARLTQEFIRGMFSAMQTPPPPLLKLEEAAELMRISPAGRAWSLSTVKSIIDNPIYTGRGIANRTTMALYYCRAADVPAEAKRTRRTPSGRPAQTLRPASDWLILDSPDLREFLPAEVRLLAAEHHDRVLEQRKDGRERTARDKHVESGYLLKGILRTVDSTPMTGRCKGRAGEVRYYAASKAYSAPTGDRVGRRMVPAEPVEATALYMLKKLLLGMPDLREQFIGETRAAVRRRAGDGQDREALASELPGVLKRLGRGAGAIARRRGKQPCNSTNTGSNGHCRLSRASGPRGGTAG